MSAKHPRIGVPVDVKSVAGDAMHLVGEKCLTAVAHSTGAIPLMRPALGEGAEIASLGS